MELVLCTVPWIKVLYIVSAGLHWTCCILSILLVILAEMLLVQYPLWFQKVYIFFGPASLNWIFFASNHILFSCFNPWEFCLSMSNYFFMASFTFSINDFTVFQLLCSFSRKVSSYGNLCSIVKSSFYKCLPKLSSNGIYTVAECFLLLY